MKSESNIRLSKKKKNMICFNKKLETKQLPSNIQHFKKKSEIRKF